jgi:excisionase family DNA binding protein
MQTMNYSEAAEYLKITPNTLRNWISQGKAIPYHKAGRRVVFFREQLEEWLLKGGGDAGKGKK